MSTNNKTRNILDLTLSEAIGLACETGNYYKTYFKNDNTNELGIILIINGNEYTSEMEKLLQVYELNLFGKTNISLKDRMALS